MALIATRSAQPEDAAFILDLNAACQPALGPLDAASLAMLMRAAHCVLVAAREDGERLGFAVAMAPGALYASDNYRWFERHVSNHLYIDRVAVVAGARRGGCGARLYAALEAAARGLELTRLTAEVNEHPPNPESLAFHAELGFGYLASRRSEAGKVVAMLEKRLSLESA
ncbi:GNAT family N-acetyltransferase [bacterium]|nr:GNAT family N-acetyltransferase [bacterium]